MNQNLAWKPAYTYFYLRKVRLWRTWITGSGHWDFGLCLTKRKTLKLILANKFNTIREEKFLLHHLHHFLGNFICAWRVPTLKYNPFNTHLLNSSEIRAKDDVYSSRFFR